MYFMNLKALSYEFGELVYQPVRPTDNVFFKNFQRGQTQEHGALSKASR
jgi:hypothetical protein